MSFNFDTANKFSPFVYLSLVSHLGIDLFLCILLINSLLRNYINDFL